jgi:hypothetical protein
MAAKTYSQWQMVMNNCRRAVLRKAKEAQLVQKFASLPVFKRIRKIVKSDC